MINKLLPLGNDREEHPEELGVAQDCALISKLATDVLNSDCLRCSTARAKAVRNGSGSTADRYLDNQRSFTRSGDTKLICSRWIEPGFDPALPKHVRDRLLAGRVKSGLNDPFAVLD